MVEHLKFSLGMPSNKSNGASALPREPGICNDGNSQEAVDQAQQVQGDLAQSEAEASAQDISRPCCKWKSIVKETERSGRKNMQECYFPISLNLKMKVASQKTQRASTWLSELWIKPFYYIFHGSHHPAFNSEGHSWVGHGDGISGDIRRPAKIAGKFMGHPWTSRSQWIYMEIFMVVGESRSY